MGPGEVEGVPTDGRRARAARGAVINTGFLAALQLLGLVKGFLIAGFISVSEYGVWGLILASSAALFALARVGITDKYVQQDAADQEAAFQLAFTLQLILNAIFFVLFVGTLPLFAIGYGNWDILLPGLALAFAIPSSAFQTPLWTFYKRMDYMRQRRIQAVDPALSIVVSLVFAVLGFGYWALVIGVITGAWGAALLAIHVSPYKLAWRYERGTVREYWSFSGPLFFQGVCISVIALTPTVAAQRALGVAAVGAMAIANNIAQYTTKVDTIMSSTLYPVVCAVKNRRDLMQEAFLKSNKLGMLWGTPTGLSIVLFAPDLVDFGIGGRWENAIPVIQAYGAVAVLNQMAVNWSVFYRAIGNTKPLAVGGAVMAIGCAGVATPLLLSKGLVGFSVGYGCAILVFTVVRLYYVKRLFSLRMTLINIVRGMGPGLIAFGVIGAIRLLVDQGERTEATAIGEIALFTLIALGVTFMMERSLLSEVTAYLRNRKPSRIVDAPAA
jgi:O-antigen/teichoic acid export membrane protein